MCVPCITARNVIVWLVVKQCWPEILGTARQRKNQIEKENITWVKIKKKLWILFLYIMLDIYSGVKNAKCAYLHLIIFKLISFYISFITFNMLMHLLLLFLFLYINIFCDSFFFGFNLFIYFSLVKNNVFLTSTLFIRFTEFSVFLCFSLGVE